MAIFSFNNPILLWGANTRGLVFNVILIQVLLQLQRYVFFFFFFFFFPINNCKDMYPPPPIVRTQDLDGYIKLSLNHLVKNLKYRSNFSPSLHQINPCTSRIMINKCKKIRETKERNSRGRPPNIRVNQTKRNITFIITQRI